MNGHCIVGATEEEIDDLQALDDAVMDLENHVNTVKERATAELASIETIKVWGSHGKCALKRCHIPTPTCRHLDKKWVIIHGYWNTC